MGVGALVAPPYLEQIALSGTFKARNGATHLQPYAFCSPDDAKSLDSPMTVSYKSSVKSVHYTLSVTKTLKRYGNMADRVRQAMRERAEDSAAHANNVKALKGSTGLRLRIGDFRVIYEESETEIVVTDFGPLGGIYDD